jgi:hypothetical protein
LVFSFVKFFTHGCLLFCSQIHDFWMFLNI